MMKSLAIAGAALVFGPSAFGVEAGPPVQSEPRLVLRYDLSLEMARLAAQAALEECRAKGFHTGVAVVDRAGQVLVSMRDEQATPQILEMARRKAYTARMFRVTTLDWVKRMTDDPSLEPQRDLPDVLALGGGAPIKVGQDTIGGVGSSGSNQMQDDLCAKAGAAKAESLMK
jgi:uncharacterized protein GlcG (DUF336 family)